MQGGSRASTGKAGDDMSETTAWLDAGAKLATADGKSSAPKSAASESQVNRSRRNVQGEVSTGSLGREGPLSGR